MNRQQRAKSRQFSTKYTLFPRYQFRWGVASVVISLVLSLLILKLSASNLSNPTLDLFAPAAKNNLAGKKLDSP